MKLSLAAVLESPAPRRAALARALASAGLKVTRAASAQALRSEQLVVLGPGLQDPRREAALVRSALPTAILLSAQARPGKPPAWADGVLPLPVSVRDLAARRWDFTRLLGGDGDSEGTGIASATGFYTFAYFKEMLFVEVKRARRYGFPVALALVGVDPLRKLDGAARRNLLGSLALAIRRSLRDTDVPVQYSPDRILILMPHTNLAGAVTVSQRICERVAKGSLAVGRRILKPTVSVGVASVPIPGRELSFAELFQNAQSTFQAAQAEGGNRVEFYDSAAAAAGNL